VGGFEQHRPAEQSGGGKSPCGAFLDARLAQSTRAHKKTVSVEIRWRALAWSWRRGAENTASVKSDNGFV